ncbi:hypothetical protein [Streptomyces sp. NPDC029003]|uniref:hypothetical protein n=1 Tax=Streptomyces sp. NPDC029003 TaxID=3155125 RepID=UPI0033EC9699
MSRSTSMKRSAVVLCTALTLIGGATVTASAAGAPITNHCGGEFQDYFGSLMLDKPFEGDVSVGGAKLPLTITPKSIEGRLRVEYSNGSNNRAAISMAMVKVDNLGNGQLAFKTVKGDGWSTSVSCTPGLTRVTKMTGSMEVVSQSDPTSVDTVEFTVART